jgi:hypothetical protein
VRGPALRAADGAGDAFGRPCGAFAFAFACAGGGVAAVAAPPFARAPGVARVALAGCGADDAVCA